jgi:hypothetical protein
MLTGLKGLLLAAIGLAAATALGGLALAQQGTPTVPAPAPAACPTGVTLTVSAPSASAPTTVSVTLSSQLNIKPASAADPTSFHLHYFVDTDPAAAGQLVPTGNPKIIHSASTTQDLGALTAGPHTVSVVLGQVSHTACAVRGSVTFTVAAPLPGTGSGGDLDQTSSGVPMVAWLALAGASFAVLCVGAGLRRRARRG